jgi:SMC interacting uncharacterized protein involved in chromosome segregation
MIENTIGELEAKIRALESAGGKKSELLQLLAQLKSEIHEREQQRLKPLKHSVDELRGAVDGFEQSHPKLVQIVNNISNTLANWGI